MRTLARRKLRTRRIEHALRQLEKTHYRDAEACGAVAFALRQEARYDEADHLLEQSIRAADLRSAKLGCLSVADLLIQRGVLYKELGRYADAEKVYQRALAIVKREAAPDDARRADLYHNLGGLEHARRRPARGEPFARRAVAMRSRILGEEHPDVAADTAALAAILDAQGKYDEAERLYQRALAIFRRAGRAYDVAVNLNNLAALYQARGEAERTERLYKRALVIKEKLFGSDHPDVAMTLNNLALFYKALGWYRDAGPVYERSLRILQATLGPSHPTVATCLYNYAQFLKAHADALEDRAAQIERDREEMSKSEPPSLRPEYVCFRLVVRPSRIHRWGVYADERIPTGHKVIEYTGERISRREIVRRTRAADRVYVFRLDDYWGIDGAAGGSGAEYINHSCEPNLRARVTRSRVEYVSRRAIVPGEELTVDYCFSARIERIPCYCGAPTCRGTINVLR